MAGMTSRAVGWLAGRIGGEKKRKGAMDWMQKTGAGQILGALGDYGITTAALGGAGKLKDLLMGSPAAASAPVAGAAAAAPSTSAGTLSGGGAPLSAIQNREELRAIGDIGRQAASAAGGGGYGTMLGAAPMQPPSTASTAIRMAGVVGGDRAEAPEVPMSPVPVTSVDKRAAAKKGKDGSMAGRAMRYLLQPGVFGPLATSAADAIGSSQARGIQERQVALQEQQAEQERQRQERLAQLLMPMFQQQISQYGRTR